MDAENKVEEPFVPFRPIASLDQPDLSGRYSYADYFRWGFRERVALLRGWTHKMSPAPGIRHQSALTNLTVAFGTYFKKRTATFS